MSERGWKKKRATTALSAGSLSSTKVSQTESRGHSAGDRERQIKNTTTSGHMQTDIAPRSYGEEKKLSGVLAGFIGGLTKSALRQSLKTDA